MKDVYLYDGDGLLDNLFFNVNDKDSISNLIGCENLRSKCVISVECGTQPSLVNSNWREVSNGEFYAKDVDMTILSLKELKISLLASDLKVGVNYDYRIFVSIDTPECIINNKAAISTFVKRESEILNICFCYASSVNDKFEHRFRTYESYGSYGFFLVDIKKIEKFFDNYGREIGNNLIEEFTTTEIAGDIFDNGLAVLCWGGTPWLYYIESGEEENKGAIGDKTEYVGIYNLDETISELSVIPGDALSDWDACKVKEWPRISVVGGGNKVKVELFIKKEYSTKERIDTGITSPIPTFFISRCDNDDRSEPLLSYSIF